MDTNGRRDTTDPPEPAAPTDPAQLRREKMMAFQLGALEDDEMALIRGRLESDPDWKKAREEAQAMLIGLSDDGPVRAEVPGDLGGRTIQRIREIDRRAVQIATPPTTGERTPPPGLPFSRGGEAASVAQSSVLSPQSFRNARRLAAAIFFICALPVGWLAVSYFWQSPGGESILWRTDSKLAAGTPFAPFLIVRDAVTQRPQSGVHLAAYLSNSEKKFAIGDGVTDGSGLVTPPLEKGGLGGVSPSHANTPPPPPFQGGENNGWRIPDVAAGNYKLVIEAKNGFGSVIDHVERDVQVTRAARLALSPDRTQARPGETIRVRTLLVSNAGEKPLADQAVTIDLTDPAGNRIGRFEKRSSKFGLAWAEFPLDSAAPEGSYKLSADCNGMKSERSIEVKQYKLPPFQVTITPAKPWFGSLDALNGEIVAMTFDGHPIAHAAGEAKLLDANDKLLAQSKLELDGEGKAKLDLPPLKRGARGGEEQSLNLQLAVTLTDPAGRSAGGNASIHVCDQPVIITAVAEAGELVQGLANKVYIVARTPDGKPAMATLEVSNSASRSADRIQTDSSGVAVYEIANPKMPAEVIQVRLSGPPTTPSSVSIPVRAESRGRLLVRTEKTIYRGGEDVMLGIYAAPLAHAIESAVVSLRQDGQTIATSAATIVNDKGEHNDSRVHIPSGISGVVTVVASATAGPNQIWTDTRTILVTGSSGVRVVAAADKTRYRPGERAKLDFTVSDAGGTGIPAAVSVVGVDQALLALTGEHPGLAQALQAAGVNVFKQPDFPLDPSSIAAEDGNKIVAHAAMAGVRAPDEKETRGSEFVDTSESKIATANAERDRIALEFKQWLLVLLVIGSALLVITWSWMDSAAALYSAAPMTTFLTCGVGIFAANVLYPNASVFGIMAFATLLISHVTLIFLCGQRPDNRFDRAIYGSAAILSDMALGGLALLALNASHHETGFFAGLFVVGLIGALFVQLNFSRPVKQRVVSGLGLVGIGFAMLVLGGILLPSLETSGRSAVFNGLIRQSAKRERAAFNSGFAMMKPESLSTGAKAERPENFDTGKYKTMTDMAQPAHLRWDFPETMIFAPEIVTDERGHATYALDVADSLTSWRVEADAIASSGGTGFAQCSLIVTQPFSADLSLPTDVTAGDVLTVPAIVSNHTDTERDVALTLDLSGATILDGLTRSIHVGAKSVAAAEFKVKFDKMGKAKLKLTAQPTALPPQAPPFQGGENDVVERELTVLPDGQPVAFNASTLVNDDGGLDVIVPENALPETISTLLRFHRGPLTQMIEGLESMLQEPHGCFEQTSSSTYPNIMVLRYLRANGIAKPDVEKRALDFIARGYQRLLGFEVNGQSGGFSLFGHAPASTWLTAYGLMEFTDMSAVYPVDPALLERMRAFLRSRLKGDGSFDVDDYHAHEMAPSGIAATAYVVMAMGKSAPPESIRYLREHAREIEQDSYLCAISANALMMEDRATAGQFAGKLRGLAQLNAGQKSAILPARRTLAWGYGDTAAVESSALGALALMESGSDLDFAKTLLAGIQQRAGAQYGWGSTHATVLALRALERGSSAGRKSGAARAIVEVNGKALLPIDLPAEETAIPVVIPVALPVGKSHLKIKVDGGPIAINVTGKAYATHPPLEKGPGGLNPLAAQINYDSHSVQKGSSVLGTMTLNVTGARAEVPMAEWGLPAGFEPDSGDLDALKAKGKLARWELSGRTVRLYLPDMSAGQKETFNVRFYANSKGQLSSPAGKVYEYYRSGEAVALAPARFEVR